MGRSPFHTNGGPSAVKGRIALITGASRGIGRAVALQLARDGFFVAINYLKEKQAAQEVYKRVKGEGSGGVLLPFDVTRADQVQAAVKAVSRDMGTIDTLVNNAGVIRDRPLVGMSDEDWYQVISTDLFGVYHCTKAVVRTWAGRRKGRRIINIGSVAGEAGNPFQTNYCAAKGGVVAFTKALAKELGPKGITVNTVSPGLICTEAVSHLHVDDFLNLIPAGRMGLPEEVAQAVSFLASDKAGYITGQDIRINGGQYM
ncbi:MAG: 3-oxoacyl-ACP reductase family protein [Desulfobacteraceae bacterium]